VKCIWEIPGKGSSGVWPSVQKIPAFLKMGTFGNRMVYVGSKKVKNGKI